MPYWGSQTTAQVIHLFRPTFLADLAFEAIRGTAPRRSGS